MHSTMCVYMCVCRGGDRYWCVLGVGEWTERTAQCWIDKETDLCILFLYFFVFCLDTVLELVNLCLHVVVVSLQFT